MQTYNVSRLPSMIKIGYDGENNWRPQAFDCTSLLQNHPNGTISLWLLPHGETQAFPVALERDGNTVVWTPLSEEMTAATGALQLVCTDGTDVGKSAVVLFRVDESILPGADHPSAVPSWATQVVADVTEQADRAEEAAESIGESIGEQLPGAIADYLEEHPVTVTETDPTVPAWAKAAQKPSYTAAEVGALPDTYTPPVQSVNGKTGAVTLSASDVGALPDSTVIPTVPQMATDPDMTDWTAGKTVDAAVLATFSTAVGQALEAKYSKPSGGIPASDLADAVKTSLGKADTALQEHQSLSGYATEQWVQQKGYQTAAQVQSAIAAIPAELPDVTSAFANDFLCLNAQKQPIWKTVPSAESNSFGGGN